MKDRLVKEMMLYQNENKCGNCNSDNLNWQHTEHLDHSVRYDYTCQNCNFEGSEWHNLVFDYHTPYGKS
jgi:hypothetical protein